MSDEEMKHLGYFGLQHNPFPVAPDIENFYLCENTDRIVTEIVHGIITRKGFMVFTGEIGLGKTTICRKVISILEEREVNTSLVFHTFYQETELLREINRDFGLNAESLVLGDQMKVLSDFLLSKNRQGRNCAIIIDDAQNLNHKSLELIRMISNLEADREKLVQILLIGQPELSDELNSHDLRQLKSRIMIREEVKPLSREELTGYIMFKLNMAGDTGKIRISKGAARKIYKFTHGNYRQVNSLMERCLYVAFLQSTLEISGRIVTDAQRDLHPGERVFISRRLAWGLPGALVFCAAVGILFPNTFSMVPWTGQDDHISMSIVSDGIGGMLKKSVPLQSREASASSDENSQGAGSVPAVVIDFLKGYGLSEFGSTLYEAMKEDRLHEVACAIFEQTGYQMVQLDRDPVNIRDRYGLLSMADKQRGSKSYLLFWKPGLNVTKFYLGYQGQEIKKLQELLAAQRLYNYSLDGIVGPRLVAAVNCCQDAFGLEVTGLPDPRTIFLLCHAQGDIRS
ncbi:MAG: AAA family ATPase [Deltaproteobacteria bacterium]|nr:AAA family ATPase [Deltaproteobacteria bacterium]